MTLNLLFQTNLLLLGIVNGILVSLSPMRRDRYDKMCFWLFSWPLIGFAAFRPLGIGLDDVLGYGGDQYERACPTFQCHQILQGSRDQFWYSLVGILKSIYPSPRVTLWVAGLGLLVKCWIISRLCHQRCVALLLYTACFYLLHDITELRASFAIAAFLLAFFWLSSNKLKKGATLLILNGFFHIQGFVAPLLLLGRSIPWSPWGIRLGMVIPFVLLNLGIYPNDAVLHYFLEQSWSHDLAKWISGASGGYLTKKLSGGYEGVRLWPIVVPPTLLLGAWLIKDLFRKDKGLFLLTSSSLFFGSVLLWAYAFIPDMQVRFWNFFFVPLVFVVGNSSISRLNLAGVFMLSAIYVMKYTVIHDFLVDHGQI